MKAIYKNLSSLFVILLLSMVCAASGNQSQENRNDKKKKEILILSYNVRNCRGLDNQVDYRRIAGIINRIDADVVALQELDSATQRSNGVVVINELASETKMHASFSASIAFQGGKYGVGILSKEKPLKLRSVPLPGREEKRSLLIAEYDEFIFCCTHFSLNDEDRLESAKIINELFSASVKPVFLAGDLNAVPESSPIRTIETKWTMLNNPLTPTIPADKPLKCIDYIFAHKAASAIVVKGTLVENEPLASDHLPVWVKIKIQE